METDRGPDFVVKDARAHRFTVLHQSTGGIKGLFHQFYTLMSAHTSLGILLHMWEKKKSSVVSGLSSSKVSACSMLIKEFCGGKAGWNDRAIFIETNFG